MPLAAQKPLFCILKYSAKSGKALVFAYEEYLDILRKDT